MNKYTKGIKRALEMQKWSNKRGGLPVGKDPFGNGDAMAFDRRALCWFASMRQRGLAQGTIDATRWALLRYRRWLLKNHRGSFQRLRTLPDRSRAEAFLQSVAEDALSTPQTQVRLVATLKRCCSGLANEKFLRSDPLSKLPSPKAKRRPLPRYLPLPVVISREPALCCPPPRLQTLLSLSLATGTHSPPGASATSSAVTWTRSA